MANQSIFGPGIGAGSAEIAAVNVGVYANTAPLVAGMAEAKVQVARAATDIAVEGKVAGHGFTQNLIGNLLDKGTHLRHAAHQFTRAITSTMLVGEIAVGAFEVGTKIGEAIFGGTESSLEHVKRQVDSLGEYARKQLGDKFADFGKTRNKEGGPGLILIDSDGEQKRITEVGEEIARLNAKIAETQKRVDGMIRHFRIVPDPLELAAMRELQSFEKELEQDKKALENERVGILSKIQGLKEAAAEASEREKKSEQEMKAATLEREASERRIAAQRDVQASRTATDISRIRALMELQSQQRYGPSPGIGIVRGGGR